MPELGGRRVPDDLVTPEGRQAARDRQTDQWLQYGIEQGKRMNRSLSCQSGIHRNNLSHERCSFPKQTCWCECHDDQEVNFLLP